MNLLADLFGKILGAFLLPPVSLILLGFWGVWREGRKSGTGRWIVSLSLALLLASSLPVVALFLIGMTQVTCEPISQLVGQADAIVVLGGGVRRRAEEFEGEASVDGYELERLRYAARIYRVTGLPVLVSGGSTWGGPPEAWVMRDTLLRDFSIPVRWIEDRSRTTRENAIYSAKILKEHQIKRILLVSQGWHLRRAVEAFRREGLLVKAAGTGCRTQTDFGGKGWIPHPEALTLTYWAAHEWVGSLWYQVLFSLRFFWSRD